MPSYGPEVLGPPPRQTRAEVLGPRDPDHGPREDAGPAEGAPAGRCWARSSTTRSRSSRTSSSAAGITSPDDIKTLDDIRHIPLDGQAGSARLRGRGTRPGAPTGSPIPAQAVRVGHVHRDHRDPHHLLWTRRDLWIEYESSARIWWRYGHRPGMIVTHAHPAYLYGGGPMLSGSYEYFGMLNIWVPPPDTDELAEQGLRFWTRVKPDIPFMGFSTGRFFEVAAKVGHRPQGRRARVQGHARFRDGQGHAPHDGRRRVLRLRRRGLRRAARAPTSTRTWASSRPSTPPPGPRWPTGSGATWSSPPSTATTACCATTSRRPAPSCASRAPCGETSIRGLWGGRFKDLIAVQGTRFQANEVESALRAVADDQRAHPRVADGAAHRGRPAAGRCGWSGARAPAATTPRSPPHVPRRHPRPRSASTPPSRCSPARPSPGPATRRPGWSTSDGHAPGRPRRHAPGDPGRRAARPRRATGPTSLGAVCGEHRLDLPRPRRPGQPAGQRPQRRRAWAPGDRLLWLGQNCHRLLEGLLAAAKIGAVFCPANWRQSADEFAFVIDDSRSRRSSSGRRPRSARPCARSRRDSRVEGPVARNTTARATASYEAFLAGGAGHRSRARPSTRPPPSS